MLNIRSEKILSDIKYPSEYSRTILPLKKFLNFYKASEFRNSVFYLAIPVLKTFLPTPFYTHFAKYSLFIRILCNDKVKQEDLILALKLIITFSKETSDLYGSKHMTFNLHSNLHLPMQVKR